MQDSQGIARSEILLVLGIYDLIKMNLSLKVARKWVIQLQIRGKYARNEDLNHKIVRDLNLNCKINARKTQFQLL